MVAEVCSAGGTVGAVGVVDRKNSLGIGCSNNNNNVNGATNNLVPFINLDQGDPTVWEAYWRRMNERCRVVIEGWEHVSYMCDMRNVCWFMKPELMESIKRLHDLVGNAETEDAYIVVGTGSTQLFQAALYALSHSHSHPLHVIAASPYYSEYKDEVEIVRSGLYKWSGNALEYDKEEAFIEVVTSPNNPDGSMRVPVVNKNKSEGKVIHDLAYYWPHYTPITHKANHDLMLFTFSKCTGHAGSRIGWAIVKDMEVAKRMTRFIQMSSIGVSKEAQIRAAKIMDVTCENYQNFGTKESDLFFQYSKRIMKERWERLREVVNQNGVFSLPKFPKAFCNFTHETSESCPAFAWLKIEEKEEECESYLEKKLKVLARGGKRFGVDSKYARLSMLGRDEEFDEFLKRLSKIKGIN